MKKIIRRPAAKKPKAPKKSYVEREYGLTKAELRRAAKAIDGEIAEARRKGEMKPLKGLQDLRPSARPKRRLSWVATARAMASSKEDWRGLDRAALARVRKGIAEAGAGRTHDLGSFARYSGTRVTASQRRRLVAAVNAQIAHYRHCRQLLRHVTADVLSAGRDIFTSEAALALWLCEPAKALDGVTPISLVRQAKGRARVVELIHAIAHGVYL